MINILIKKNIFIKRTNFLSFFLLFLALQICFVNINFAQKFKLKVIKVDSVDFKYIDKKKYNNVINDSISIYSELEFVLKILQKKGFASASFDKIEFVNNNCYAYLYIGSKFVISDINVINKNSKTLRKTNLFDKKFKNKSFNEKEVNSNYKSVLESFENKGYPFVKINQDSFNILNQKISIKISVNPNNSIYIRNIFVKSEKNVNERLLLKYLKIRKNELYNEKKLQQIEQLTNKSSFVKTIKFPEIEFFKDSADLYIYVKPEKANFFNGIIGFLPKKENSGKLLVTGELAIDLSNNLRRNETLSLNWKRNEAESQKLQGNFRYPYLFNTYFGINLGLQIEKKDTSYLVSNIRYGVNYFFICDDYIELFMLNRNSVILSKNIPQSENFSESKAKLYGFSIKTENTDYKFNPRLGYKFLAEISSGQKQTKNLKNTNLYEAFFNFEYYIPIVGKFVLKSKATGKYMFSNLDFYVNELNKFGGFNSLRGFDEDEILATEFSMLSLEMRYLYEKKSNFFVFFESAYFKRKSVTEKFNDTPFGFGLGTLFETQAGFFSISYALGKQQSNPIQLSGSKVHFGYINRF